MFIIAISSFKSIFSLSNDFYIYLPIPILDTILNSTQPAKIHFKLSRLFFTCHPVIIKLHNYLLLLFHCLNLFLASLTSFISYHL